MEKSELIVSFSSRIMNTDNVLNEGATILDEINTLVYSNSREHLSDDDKIEIVNSIYNQLNNSLNIKYKGNLKHISESTENYNGPFCQD